MAENIFLVEDEEFLREVMVMSLSNSGYLVDSAENAEECIFHLGHKKYDLLISDVMLPGMSGLELLAFVKEKLSFMPVILITGLNDVASAVEALRLGAADYLCKPFKNEELLLRIERCLEHSDLKHRLTREKELERKLFECLQELEDSRASTKIILEKSENIKDEVEQRMVSSVQALILPLLSELELLLVHLPQEVDERLQMLKQALVDITAPFAHSVTSKYFSLTPREIQIANFIRLGKTSKEIARLAKITYATVESHRDTIRKKLGIKNRKVSLMSFLRGLDQ